MIYISVDGDDIGKILTKKIYVESNDDVCEFSDYVTSTFTGFAEWVKSHGGDVIFCAGDSILFRIAQELTEDALLQLKSEKFTISIGLGSTIKEAHWALNMAKSLGKARSIHFADIKKDIFGYDQDFVVCD